MIKKIIFTLGLTGLGWQQQTVAVQQLTPGGGIFQQQYAVHLIIPDSAIVSSWHWLTGMPSFIVPGINNLLSSYGVMTCVADFPESRFPHMRNRYKIWCNDTAVITAINSNFGEYIRAGAIPEYEPMAAYYPNDWWTGYNHQYYLNYINAPWAWSITKGDPNVVIGINDTYIDGNHPELSGKLTQVNNTSSFVSDHGTMVTGFAVGGTNNGFGISSIGFNCRAQFNNSGTENMLWLSNQGRRIINGSWGTIPLWGNADGISLQLEEKDHINWLYNEIYENGTFTVQGAGNGRNRSDSASQPNRPWYYAYPASLDFVFSVSDVGWNADNNGTNTWLVKGMHERTLGDSLNTYQRNSRVDLLAPGVHLDGLTNNGGYFPLASGTSFSAPMVAGTAGLMHSVRGCLSPYQTEYLLKKGANDTILNYPENAPYSGRLGAGALDAYKSVFLAAYGEKPLTWGQYKHKDYPPTEQNRTNPCNDPKTQTMYISGIEISGICRPANASNGHKPKLKPVIVNGKPPYTYRWVPVGDTMTDGNNTILSSKTAAEPEIVASYGYHKAKYHLYVYDNSPVQKVAAKYIEFQLTDTASYDLASRDSYMDMMDEPNSMQLKDPRDWSIWHSPDIWVRHYNDNGVVHQQPEYFDTKPNYVHVRVRNVGCQPGPGNARVRVYWTKASTGENWKYDWDGTTQVGSSNGGLIPAGGHLDASPQSVPVLQPGEAAILKYEWHPTRPEDFLGSPNSVDVCLLSRIEQPGVLNQGIKFWEEYNTNIAPNVWNNNNIATYNMLVKNLYPGNEAPFSIIDVSNAESFAGEFTIQFANDRFIQRHHAGDFSAIGHIRLNLGSLYDRWLETDVDLETINGILEPETKSILLNGVDLFSMQNVRLEAGERFPVKVEFLVDNPAALTGNSFMFHLRQFSKDDTVKVYGNVSIKVNTHPEREVISGRIEELKLKQIHGNFGVYPNPAQNRINIMNNYNDETTRLRIFDVNGRIMVKEAFWFEKNVDKVIDINHFIPGIYFISIETESGMKEQYKFVKQ